MMDKTCPTVLSFNHQNVPGSRFFNKNYDFRGKVVALKLRVGGGCQRHETRHPENEYELPHLNHTEKPNMSQAELERFQAYRLSMDLFEKVVEDLTPLANRPGLEKLVSQQLGSADSIAANIEEGYGRESRKEYKRFLVIARGSARETRGRYTRLRKWFGEEVVRERCATCDHIISILTKTIIHLTRNP